MKKKSDKIKSEFPNGSKNAFYFLLFAYVLAVLALALLFKPFIYSLVLGATLGVFFFPLNKFLRNKGLGPNLSASLLVVLIVLLIGVSSYLFVNSVVKEVTNTYNLVSHYNFEDVDSAIESSLGLNVSSENIVVPLFSAIRDTFSVSVSSIINSLAEIFVGLLILLFLLFYIFKEGEKILASIMGMLPVSNRHKDEITKESKKVLHGVMYGHILMAFVQGFLGGFAFFIFGLKNPIFWGLMMTVLALIPLVGTAMVWIPAGLFQLVQGNLFAGIGVLAFGTFIILYMENVFKPKFLGEKAGMHPVLMVMAIFGGLKLFGVFGIIMGPILVALCVLLINFFNQAVLIRKN
ncbi:AI-2E family transporter [Candidatus Woesearchaeota archaeon]|nr:AI-2E family transporter [Candidatus Woesearchaeota archaeon]